MAVAYNWGNAQDNSFLAAGTTVNVGATAPVGTNGAFNSGDILIAKVIEFAGTGDTIVPPAGWTLIGTQQLDGSGNRTAWFWHLCTGGESGSFTFTWTTSNFFAWTLSSYTGCAASPFDGVVTVATTDGTNIVTSSITTSNVGDLLVLSLSGATTLTVPADMTSRFNALQSSSAFRSAISDRLPGTSGSFTETYSASGSGFVAYMFAALKPPDVLMPQAWM